MKPKPGMIWPGGFRYVQDDIPLEGINEDEVIKLMQAHRMMFNRPRVHEDDCRRDLYDSVCNAHPHFCNPEPGEGKPIVMEARKATKPRLIDRVFYWTSHLWRNMDKSIHSYDEATSRARICEQCPKMRQWDNCHTCGSNIAEAKRLLNMVRQGQNLDYVKAKGCDVFGFDCETAAFLKNGFTKMDGAPEPCWVNKL